MWKQENIPSLQGKTALVTGANSGIGREIARALHKAGAHVILAGRNEQALQAAVVPQVRTTTALLDLSSLQQVAAVAAGIRNRFEKLDILINNAGVMTPPQSLSADGYELQFAVNFLGHFALTGHLYPLLANAPQARVVTMSSGAYKQAAQVNFANLRSETSYDAFREYAISKLADMQFMLELQRRLPANIRSAGAHPGVTATALSRHMDPAAYQAALVQFGELMPAWQGALPALYAATAPGVMGGDYYGPDGNLELKGYPGPAEITASAKDEDAAARLWEWAEQATGLRYP